MESIYDLPNDIVNTFLCYICKGYLSCGPIKEENGNLVCGRCNSDNLNTGVQIAFEKLLKNFSFPCVYDKQGCTERVLFNSSIQHETCCTYHTLCCPVKSCAFTLRFSEFYNHFVEEHENLILKDGSFKLIVDENSRCNFLMIKDDIAVVIKYCYDACEKSLQLNVESFPIDNKLIKYKIQIINESDYCNSLSLSEQECSVYETSGIRQNIGLLDIAKYLPVFNNPMSLLVKVEINTALINCVDTSEDKRNCQNLCFTDDLNDEFEEEMVVKLQKLQNYCVSCYYYPVSSTCKLCGSSSVAYRCGQSAVATNMPCSWRGCQFLGTN